MCFNLLLVLCILAEVGVDQTDKPNVQTLGSQSRNETDPIVIKTPLTPPVWALLERRLLDENEAACSEFFQTYFDDRGFLKCVVRWGADDGPDDAIENVADWPILHAIGADDSILSMYKKAWEGHLQQYTEARTTDVPMARDGMYFREFPVMFDWMHNGEGLRVFNLQGLSDPHDSQFQRRVRRFAGFYMNEDPLALNYDPKHRIIRSMFTGSRGPLLRNATALDWTGDPIEVEGRFKPRHGERNYAEMLAHFKDYTSTLGDHPQNLCATTLALNAYMLTGEEKYKAWLLEYVDAWVERTQNNGGIIPSNVGLDGVTGSAAGNKWYGGTYGWAFSVEVPQTGEIEHRSRVARGVYGFMNAYLLTGDPQYLDLWVQMLNVVNDQTKEIDGTTHYPRMYGDQGWYAWRPTKWDDGALESWFLSQNPAHKSFVPETPWLEFLDGGNPKFPEGALALDLERLRQRVAAMRRDDTTPDTRLADDPMEFNPASIGALNQLMQGGIDPGRGGGPLHCTVRYFDPERRRAGIPEDCAALISRIDSDGAELTLVNLSQCVSRKIIVQCGAYGEHQCLSLELDGQTTKVEKHFFEVTLEPGAGTTMQLRLKRHCNRPSMAFPWDSCVSSK